MFKLLTLAFTLAFLGACSSVDSSLGISAYSGGLKAVSGNDAGGKGIFAPFNYAVGGKVRLGDSTPFVLGLDYTLLGRKSANGASNRYLLARTLVGVLPGLSLGPSLVMHTQSGSGTIQELNNGSGTSQFATPDSSVTSWIYAADVSYEFKIEEFVIGNEFLWQSFLNKNRWNFAWLVSLQYDFN